MEPEELNVETNQRFHRLGVAALKAVLGLMAVLAVYCFLFPMVVFLCLRFGWLNDDPLNPFLESVAVPLELLAKNCRPYLIFVDKVGRMILP